MPLNRNLTNADVELIRELYAEYRRLRSELDKIRPIVIAAKFGITKGHVNEITSGRVRKVPRRSLER